METSQLASIKGTAVDEIQNYSQLCLGFSSCTTTGRSWVQTWRPVKKYRGLSSLQLAVWNSSRKRNCHSSSSSSRTMVCRRELRSWQITQRLAPGGKILVKNVYTAWTVLHIFNLQPHTCKRVNNTEVVTVNLYMVVQTFYK